MEVQQLILIISSVINAAQSTSTDWTAEIPKSIWALKDSCVVIPCLYKYPVPKYDITERRLLWLKSCDKNYEVNDRAVFLGEVNKGNCSLKISAVKKSDETTLCFRIEMPQLDSYTYKHDAVTIHVKESPDPPLLTISNIVKEGLVSASCSVSHTCPSDPPDIAWDYRGSVVSVTVQYELVKDGLWTATSVLTFSPKIDDKKITCTAKHTGNIYKSASVALTHDIAWTVKVPESLVAMKGTCVVIPCSFMHPELSAPNNHLEGFWFHSQHLVYHKDSSKVMEQYRNRAQLLGSLREGNCSLKIEQIQPNDGGSFHFRIQMTGYNYSFLNYKVHITVEETLQSPLMSLKEVVNVGDSVSVSCSVFYSCPTDAPSITWSRNGRVTEQAELLKNGPWRVTSVLSFNSSISDNNKELICVVKYKKGKPSSMSKTLTVLYPPEIKSSSACIKNIMDTICDCYVDANPPATVDWRLPKDNNLRSTRETSGSLTTLSLHVSSGLIDMMSCFASNELGNATFVVRTSLSDVLISIYASVSVAVAIVIILVILGLWKCNKEKKEKRKQTDKKDYATKDITEDIYVNNETAFCASGDVDQRYQISVEDIYANM